MDEHSNTLASEEKKIPNSRRRYAAAITICKCVYGNIYRIHSLSHSFTISFFSFFAYLYCLSCFLLSILRSSFFCSLFIIFPFRLPFVSSITQWFLAFCLLFFLFLSTRYTHTPYNIYTKTSIRIIFAFIFSFNIIFSFDDMHPQ